MIDPKELEKIERFEKVFRAFGDTVSAKEVQAAFEAFWKIIQDHVTVVDKKISNIDKSVSEFKEETESGAEIFSKVVLEKLNDARKSIDAKLASIKDGYTPKKGVDYRDGKDADEEAMLRRLLAAIPPAKEFVPETPDETVDKINKSSNKIKSERVEGLERLSDIERMARANGERGALPPTTSFFNGIRAKNLEIVGATAARDGDTARVTLPTSSSLGYTLQGSHSQMTWTDGTVRYVGNAQNTPSTSEGNAKIYFPASGTVTAIYILTTSATGSAELTTVDFRLNGTTDTQISTALSFAAGANTLAITGLSIAVTAGQYFELKLTCPTFGTDPTQGRISFVAYIQ